MKEMYDEKYLRDADLILSFHRCMYGRAVPDCPFKKFQDAEPGDALQHPIMTLTEPELEEMRIFHRGCMERKLSQAGEEPGVF
jgi:hypothetical protein